MIALLVLLALVPPAPGATLTVDPGGVDGYTTIQAAIDAATSGDAIEVVAGSYAECLDLSGKDLWITGLGGAEGTFLVGDGACAATVTAAAGESLGLRGLAITGETRAIQAAGGDLSLEEVTIHDAGDGSVDGGGISLQGGLLLMDGCTVRDNLGSAGGGLYLSEGSEALITASTFSGNQATSTGGGIHAMDSSLTLEDLAVSENLASSGGGGLYMTGEGELSLADSTVQGNLAEAGAGGGLYYSASTPGTWTLLLDRVEVVDNGAGSDGAGVYAASAGTLLVSGSRFVDNLPVDSAASTRGGGLAIREVALVGVDTTWFCGNQAEQGAGAYAHLVDLADWSNDLFVENAGRFGAGLYLAQGVDVTLANNSFLGNEAERAAVELDHSATTWVNNLVAWTATGAALYGEGGSSSAASGFSFSAWYDNEGGDGSGTHLDVTSGVGMVTVDPLLSAYSMDGDCDNDDLLPAVGSPLVDAGDPDRLDPDGGRSDIGAYGGAGAVAFDDDRDGSWLGEDCDDADATAFPGAEERCDGADDDCDGEVDEEAVDASTWYTDGDGDGYGLDGTGEEGCEVPAGAAAVAGDCADEDPLVSPGVAEVAYDGVDNDCAGGDLTDVDGDGVDGEAVAGGTDCDDLDRDVYPDAVDDWYDGVDADCDGAGDYDADADGQDGEDWGGTDCDDADPTVYFGAVDAWYDGVDADCGRDDDADADGDGQGALAAGGTDCDDADAEVYAGASDTWYDGLDGDCDGQDDYDADGDGYRTATWAGDDCDDTDAAVNPGAADTWYDGVDGDCDGESDYDMDGDGEDAEDFGGTDCDDADATINGEATDLPDDGIDQDCDGADATEGGDDTGDGGATDGGGPDGGATDGGGDGGGEADGKGGCSTAAGAATVAWLVPGLLLWGRVGRPRRKARR